MKKTYPTFIYNDKKETEYPFLVCVPDLEIFTEGSSFEDAIEMAKDAIGLAGTAKEDMGIELPESSTYEEAIKKMKEDVEDIDFSEGVIVDIEVDFDVYRKEVLEVMNDC